MGGRRCCTLHLVSPATPLDRLALEKAHQRALDLGKPSGYAAAKQGCFELTALVRFDHAWVDLARPRDAARVDQDFARLISRLYRASAEALAFLTEHNGHETEKLRKQAIPTLVTPSCSKPT